MNTDLRIKAKNEFKKDVFKLMKDFFKLMKDFFKLMNNSVFEKNMEKV